ncbi:MAG: sulfite oxidase [Pseudomonadota bacterium]
MPPSSKLPSPPGRRPLTRRDLLHGGAFAVAGATVVGLPIPFARFLPAGVLLLAHAADGEGGKEGLTHLSDRPVNMETPAHLLDDEATLAHRLFVRNNGLAPPVAEIADEDWTLTIDGEVETPLWLTIADLKRDFDVVTLRLQMECGGNGRRYFSPGASGNQWGFGAIGCPDWTGVRLADVLARAGVKESAVYTAHYGADTHLSGDPDKLPISRGMPIEKALEPHTLIAWSLGDGPLPPTNGYPLRLVVPGWPGSCSHKWLTRITLRDREHDGPKMTGQSYRVPAYPVAPGTEVPDEDMVIITSMPVKSMITFPETGVSRAPGNAFEARGHAWAGERSIAAVETSIDFGATWSPARLEAPVNKYAWARWRADVTLPAPGYYEIWARARDDAGVMQPPIAPGWNPRGYLNNMQHRVAVFAV